MITRDVSCRIERRLLVSYRIDPDRVTALLPQPFRPQVVNDYAVGGVCFIRMTALRPARMPLRAGLTTENVAHRFAVEWDDEHGSHAGVYVPRRDTDSRLTVALGAGIIPGAYHLASFTVAESAGMVRIAVRSRDREVALAVAAAPTAALDSRLFASIDEATGFFRRGALGFSASAGDTGLDAVHLHATSWASRPMMITAMNSSMFDNACIFPDGTCTLDSAMLMTDIPARWSAKPGKRQATTIKR